MERVGKPKESVGICFLDSTHKSIPLQVEGRVRQEVHVIPRGWRSLLLEGLNLVPKNSSLPVSLSVEKDVCF